MMAPVCMVFGMSTHTRSGEGNIRRRYKEMVESHEGRRGSKGAIQ